MAGSFVQYSPSSATKHHNYALDFYLVGAILINTPNLQPP